MTAQTSNLLFKNSIWLLIGRGASVLINLLITILIARTFREALFGEYSFLMAYMSVVLVISAFGMDVYLVRSVAGQKDHAVSHEVVGSLIIQLILGGLMILITMFWTFFFGSPIQSIQSLWLYLLIIVPSAFGTVFNAIQKGNEKMHFYTLYILSDLAIQVIGIYLFFDENTSIFNLILIFLIARTMAASLAGFLVWMDSSIVWKLAIPSREKLIEIFRAGSYISLAIILTTLFQKLGVLTISFNGTDSEVGTFNAANKIVEGLKILPAAFYGALFPSMVKGGKYFESKLRELKYLFSIMAIISIAGFIFSDHIIKLVFDGFEGSNALFSILILGVIPFMLRQYYSFKFMASGNEMEVFFIGLGTVILALFVYNYALCYFGLVGICWGVNLVLSIEALFYFYLKNRFKTEV